MTFRKIASLALAVLMLCSVLCACTDTPATTGPTTTVSTAPTTQPTEPKPETLMYQVAVYGADGLPATSNVIVKFLQDGADPVMQNTNEEGVAQKELPKGSYNVELMFLDGKSYYYDSSDMTLNETKTQLTINLCLAQSTEGETVYADGDEYTAYPLRTGNTYVTLKPGRNYFLYLPDVAGEYDFFTGNNVYKVGYYGGEHYIMSQDAGKEGPNNGTHVSISAGMVSPNNAFVIGVDNPGTEDVETVLYVQRVSDYIDTSIPKTTYKTTHALTPWTMPAGKQIKKFDITSAMPVKLVRDDATGYYHLNTVTGPLVVVFLGEKAADHNSYLAPYDTILKNVGVTAYFKNDEGKIDRGEVYTNCLQDYIGIYDENTKAYTGGCIDRNSGLYPLTDDLMYIIQNHGAYSGWWDETDTRYIFGDTKVNVEKAWLFMCGYLE